MDDINDSVINATLVGHKKTATLFRITLDVSGDDAVKKAQLILAHCDENQTFGLVPITKEAAHKKMVADFVGEQENGAKCAQAIKYHEDHGTWPSNLAYVICKEVNFYRFLRTQSLGGYRIMNNSHSVDTALKFICGEIESKSELDTNDEALTTFIGMLADYRRFVQESHK
jgi:hypothetical protein